MIVAKLELEMEGTAVTGIMKVEEGWIDGCSGRVKIQGKEVISKQQARQASKASSKQASTSWLGEWWVAGDELG